MADILSIGNPLLDISANVAPEYLKKYEFLFCDVWQCCNCFVGMTCPSIMLSWPKRSICPCKYTCYVHNVSNIYSYEEIVKGKVDYIAGGAALNTARVAQVSSPCRCENKLVFA